MEVCKEGGDLGGENLIVSLITIYPSPLETKPVLRQELCAVLDDTEINGERGSPEGPGLRSQVWCLLE